MSDQTTQKQGLAGNRQVGNLLVPTNLMQQRPLVTSIPAVNQQQTSQVQKPMPTQAPQSMPELPILNQQTVPSQNEFNIQDINSLRASEELQNSEINNKLQSMQQAVLTQNNQQTIPNQQQNIQIQNEQTNIQTQANLLQVNQQQENLDQEAIYAERLRIQRENDLRNIEQNFNSDQSFDQFNQQQNQFQDNQNDQNYNTYDNSVGTGLGGLDRQSIILLVGALIASLIIYLAINII